MSKIFRLHYRAQLQSAFSAADVEAVTADCIQNIRRLQEEGRLLTAALYYADKMLFLYYEAVGEPENVREPIALQPALKNAWEYGGTRISDLPGQLPEEPREMWITSPGQETGATAG